MTVQPISCLFCGATHDRPGWGIGHRIDGDVIVSGAVCPDCRPKDGA